MSKRSDQSGSCLTCYGSGEIVADGAPQVCPDCFGENKALSEGTKVEWRLRAIERAYSGSGSEGRSEMAGDVLWLVHELRRGRDVLLRIMATCQDADDSNTVARDVKFQANEALGLYDPR